MTKALIIGAGVAGKELLGELRKHKSLGRVVGFIDDNPKKKSKIISGIKVLGESKDLKQIIERETVSEVFIAIPSASGKQVREIINKCVDLNVSFKVVPRTLDIIKGKVDISEVRKIDVSDLVGRELIKLDQKPFDDFFNNKTILITGACGSIGSEIVRQLASFNPKELIFFDWWENGMFDLVNEFRDFYPNVTIKPIIGDIKDEKKLRKLFKEIKTDIVFHAAAYKHVPLMEENPSEAVKNNILGTYILAKEAKNKTDYFIFISTDKAVEPKSVMGATKLIAEGVISDTSKQSSTKFISVRFGNVLDSFGSVLPLFKKQISEGGPVTVTHKDMKRFFMSIPEAVQLIFQATVFGKGGEIFLLDMGEPIKILDLAKLLIRLSGFTPGKDIKIVFTGKRPGEKLSEELFTDRENLTKTKNQKIHITKNFGLDLIKMELIFDKLVKYASDEDNSSVMKVLKEIVPSLK